MITDEGYKRLLRFLIWCIVGCIIAIIGISNVFAETITDMTFSQFRTTVDAYGITSNQSIYDTSSSVPVNMGVSPNGFAFEWITNYTNNCSGQTIINGQMAIPNDNLNYDWLDENIKDIYYAPNINGVDGTACTYSISPSNMIISFTCSTAQPNNNFIIGGHLKYRTNTNFNTYFRIYRTFNITCDNSASAIIDNQSQNTQNIINNNNSNTQDIINNNNQNTQDIIDSNKVCISKEYVINNNNKDDYNIGYLVNNGLVVVNQNFRYSNYIPIKKDNIITINRDKQVGNGSEYCLYDNNSTKLSCYTYGSVLSISRNIEQDGYIRFTGGLESNNSTTLLIDTCENGNQILNDSINGLNDTLKDDNVDDNNIASSFEDFNDFLDDNSTITQLITLPITLYTAILNNLNGACSPFNLGALYGEDLILPCINVSQYLGSSLWNMIDIIISGFAIFAISKKMIKVFNNFSSLREGDVIDD